jgi:hypothetical protein
VFDVGIGFEGNSVVYAKVGLSLSLCPIAPSGT